MATHSLPHKYYKSLRRKPVKMVDYGANSERMNTINNNVPAIPAKKQVEIFAKWFSEMMNDNRNDMGLYLADDVVLQWFGRTVKLKKDVIGFLKYDMNCTSHSFLSVKPCGPFTIRGAKIEDSKKSDKKKSTEELATPIAGITPMNILKSLAIVSSQNSSGKRTRSVPSSPENTLKKKLKTLTDRNSTEIVFNRCSSEENLLDTFATVNSCVKYELRSLYKKKNVNFNSEFKTDASLRIKKGRLDQVNTTSRKGSLLNFSGTTGLSLLPRIYMEVKCVLQFSKYKSRKNTDLYKWDRQCTLKVAFSENPVCNGEYIIWTILYDDDNKCRRNLLADFEAVSKESEKESNKK